MIANRTASKATQLAKSFKPYGETCGFGLEKIKNDLVDIIINATSASLDGQMPTVFSPIKASPSTLMVLTAPAVCALIECFVAKLKASILNGTVTLKPLPP
jgi:shikimate 5-dehydrogenase